MPEDKPGASAAETAEEVGDTAAEGENPGNVEEGPVVPSHEPFSFALWGIVHRQQTLNGLRHNDHLRYRQYCMRRLGRLYTSLRMKHGRGRYKAVPFPADFSDRRFLHIPLVSAERAWSYAVQLKADNAAASALNPRWRRHSINRLAKAVKWAQMLESVCKVHCDQRSQLEAEAYCAFMEGTHFLEKEQWSESLTKLKLCRRLCERLALASEQEMGQQFKNKVEELSPLIRECKYNLGMAYDDNDSDSQGVKASAGAKKDISELSYRGTGLSIPSDKIKGKLMKCLGLASTVKVGEEEEKESAGVIEKYGEISAEFGEVLRDIHTDMINAGSNSDQVAEWTLLEAFARELSISINVERNIVLLWNHLQKVDGLEEMGSTEARKVCRPDEGMRFCDLLKEDLGALKGLPETSEVMSSTLATYTTIVLNCRCFFLAMCHTAMGKHLEAAALLDMLHARIDTVELGDSLDEPLGRLHPLFERVQKGMPSRVARWKCRGLAQLCNMEAKAKGKEEASEAQKPLEEFAALAAFPPRIRDVACKPLLFDLAFPSIVAPDLDHLMSKGGPQKGFLGRVSAGWGRVSGLFGNRK
uniref:Signal recognition particle subunit SRP68 n=1 Tax=Alexandrium monilatum TaxID=311494 RepID=A0A7S4R7J3_9DINO|mmetsp:Transcript_55003/g.170783  ORF Transcript_55003/g.170783 Transcript_55003/m.170783 type:complete len:586 (+) Transcript_55003:66-1823(+)